MYDVIIVGAGPSGIFTAFELKKNNVDLKILMIEKGESIEKRVCPMRKSGVCSNCDHCNVTTGFSGSGAFSDGKLSINEHGEVGGELIHYIGSEAYKAILSYTDQIYLDFGAEKKVCGRGENVEPIRKKAIQSNLKYIDSGVRHLGTEKAYILYSKLQACLLDQNVKLVFNTTVEDFLIEDHKIVGVKTNEGKNYYGKKTVVGIGRLGSQWLKGLCDRYDIETEVGIVDIGVRMECDHSITKEIDDTVYEAKLVNYTKTFDDKVRTFCWNPRGQVSFEPYDDLVAVNGHSYKDEKLKTTNTNFALLTSMHFSEPFKTPLDYGKHIAKLANMLSGGKVLVQRYGDFKRGRRTTTRRLARNNIIPTLKDAVAGDLSLVLPYRIMLDIIETIEALDHMMPGFAGNGTLMYGVEVKFYSNKINVNKNFETNIENLYVLGDGAGITRGLMQASMNGVYVGRHLFEKSEKSNL